MTVDRRYECRRRHGAQARLPTCRNHRQRIAPRHGQRARRDRASLLAQRRSRPAPRRAPSRIERGGATYWLDDDPSAWEQSYADGSSVLRTTAQIQGSTVEVADLITPAEPVLVRGIRSPDAERIVVHIAPRLDGDERSVAGYVDPGSGALVFYLRGVALAVALVAPDTRTTLRESNGREASTTSSSTARPSTAPFRASSSTRRSCSSRSEPRRTRPSTASAGPPQSASTSWRLSGRPTTERRSLWRDLPRTRKRSATCTHARSSSSSSSPTGSRERPSRRQSSIPTSSSRAATVSSGRVISDTSCSASSPPAAGISRFRLSAGWHGSRLRRVSGSSATGRTGHLRRAGGSINSTRRDGGLRLRGRLA